MRMKIVVLGLWHLGCVTAACLAKFYRVTGLDFSEDTVQQLACAKPPLFEPGLAELMQEGLTNGCLQFSSDPAKACQEADLLWVCYDTPVDDDDVADLRPVIEGIQRCLPFLAPGTFILVSSQVPVGTCRKLEKLAPRHRFAYSPENLRLGKAIDIFQNQDRIVLGVRSEADAAELSPALQHFSREILVVRPESAEMIKHAINSFLALSVSFMNEIARLCEAVGADAKEVEKGLKTESRIGPKAYLAPGGPFAGGTLARDVVALTSLGRDAKENLVLVPAIKRSNDEHKNWAERRLEQELGSLAGKRIAILGLTYKPGTDTLRRSLAVEICRRIAWAGGDVRVYDPTVKLLPQVLAGLTLAGSLAEAVNGADGMVVCTEWPEFLSARWNSLLRPGTVVVDANGFLASTLANSSGVIYRRLGQNV
jgi:UDPglucose 6-dehydrogenase